MELLKYLDNEADKLNEENFSSSDEFRTVNNSFVEGFNYALAIVQGFEIELNKTQQVVLEWLKDDYKEYGDPIIAIGDLGDEILPSRWETCLQATYEKLDTQQKWEVLAAFAEWGKKEVAE